MLDIKISRKTQTITYNDIRANYSYFSFLGNSLKYGGNNGDVIIELPYKFQIFINGVIKWEQ